MKPLSTLWNSFFGPRLYRIHQHSNREGKMYDANVLEKLGDSVVKWMRFCYSFSCWTSPVIVAILYRRGTFTMEGMHTTAKYLVSASVVLGAAMAIRALGRLLNTDYLEFLDILYATRQNLTDDNMKALSRLDFDFSAWPVNFRWNEGEESKVKPEKPGGKAGSRSGSSIKTMPCDVLSYLCAHTFGISMLYPGSTSMLNSLLHGVLLDSRRKFIEDKDGIRAKLTTEDGNYIDTMFVDRRNNEAFPNGNTLVICCEGNAGFYEIGCTVTPMEGGYSVLGWNHPGFGGSSGAPYPPQEQKAADCVMQYAIHKLGYEPKDIMVYAWSIGGYSATWLAMNYPDIGALVLDATFDDLIPLAITRMPESWGPLVKMTVRKYLNLNNAEQLIRYPGPVLIIRRSRDEMISTVDPSVIPSNRGNFLLARLLQHRFPKLVDETTINLLNSWLGVEKAGQASLMSARNIDENMCHSLLLSYVQENSNCFPLLIGDDLPQEMKENLVLYIASKYMDEFDSNHGTPLPKHFLRHPWELPTGIPDSHL